MSITKCFPLCTVLQATLFLSSLSAREFHRWDFLISSETQQWTSNDQTQLSVMDGQLKLVSNGIDPNFMIPVSTPGGDHMISLVARFQGRADVQVFWSTERSPGFSEARSVRSDFAGGNQGASTIKLYFNTDSPVTSLRIDPLSQPGQMLIDSIVLTDDAAPEPQATSAADIRVPEGFRVERLHSVQAAKHGSWVSMTQDHKGRLIVSDQYGKLHRVTPPPVSTNSEPVSSASAIQIETLPIEIGMAQGLLYAFDSLYVMVNGQDQDKQGLYRVTDSDQDDQFDQVRFLRQLDGGGEHGPHAVVLAPDGKSLYVCAGNHTNPTQFQTSRVPRVWAEDLLLPRMWDAGGHAVGKMAPGGWIAKVSPDGQDWELVASGFRNQYDIAFCPEGELFTYDADMEWDVGTPWYRPTRVNHVASGGEFGWRSGTGKWPTWFPDSLPEVVNIGQGSPTGIVFGTGTKFPEKYQRALFICDWSYGVIYAVHLEPSGSTWKGTAERFAAAAPLPATDLVVGNDGALYFTIGGRKTQSGLYRITYVGTESTEPAAGGESEHSDLRTVRRQLESLHHANATVAVSKAWPYLGHSDRYIRFAARIAIEHRPVAEWQQQALTEDSSADASITALLALARHGDKTLIEELGTQLGYIASYFDLTEEQSLAGLRVLQLALIRMDPLSDKQRRDVGKYLSERYPAASPELNRELCTLLVFLQDDQVAGKTIPLMQNASTQEEQMFYALCLRTLQTGWTIETRTAYFKWFLNAAGMAGGNSFGGFLKNIREEAIQSLSATEAQALQEILAQSPTPAEPMIEATSRPLVQEWQVQDLVGDVERGLKGRNYENGRRMFTITGCYKCHRFGGKGGIVGPDLTGVARRFNARNLLESLIEPSKVISDQYEATVFVTANGQQVIGRVVNLNNDTLLVSQNMLNPGQLTPVKRSDVEETFVSKTSMMPNGLLNSLTREEVLDLVAFLQSGGDPQSPVYVGR